MGNDQLDAQTSARLLRKAVLVKGGVEALSAALGVRSVDLLLWIHGRAFPPMEIFEAVLGIVLDSFEGTGAEPIDPRLPSTEPRRPRVLVADSVEGVAVIAAVLGQEFDLIPVHNVADALDILQASTFVPSKSIDVVVAGQHFEGSQMLHFLECVKSFNRTASIPFVCCRSLPTRIQGSGIHAMREACHALGALVYVDITDEGERFSKETAVVEFREAIRSSARGASPDQLKRILVVDDNPEATQTLCLLLRLAGYTVEMAGNGNEALRTGQLFTPHVVIPHPGQADGENRLC